MTQNPKASKSVMFYLISPASYVIYKAKLRDSDLILFRITVNICYYTFIISIYCILTF